MPPTESTRRVAPERGSSTRRSATPRSPICWTTSPAAVSWIGVAVPPTVQDERTAPVGVVIVTLVWPGVVDRHVQVGAAPGRDHHDAVAEQDRPAAGGRRERGPGPAGARGDLGDHRPGRHDLHRRPLAVGQPDPGHRRHVAGRRVDDLRVLTGDQKLQPGRAELPVADHPGQPGRRGGGLRRVGPPHRVAVGGHVPEQQQGGGHQHHHRPALPHGLSVTGTATGRTARSGAPVRPSRARSARISPTTGTNLKPCPEKPQATTTFVVRRVRGR